MKKILIIGATSAIANACAKLWAKENAQLFLAGRNASKLNQIAADLKVRGADKIETYEIDLTKIELHQAMIDKAFESLKTIDIILIAHGTLPNQKNCEENVEVALQEFNTNGLSVIALLTLIANKMQQQKFGTIAVISSVAGNRGRFSNYLYGSAKAAVTIFCEGLRARLFHAGVHVMTIKPGFVDTPMTKGLSLPKPLLATPNQVAQDILNGIEKKKNVIYSLWFWRFIMLIIVNIPNSIFKRLKI
jgi:short-subunit dehydrogenase